MPWAGAPAPHEMIEVVAALAPVFLVIVLGHGLARATWFPEAFWRSAETLTYYVLLPALLLTRLAAVEAAALDWAPMAAALVLAVLAVAGALVALKPWLGLEDAAFTSVHQGAIRVNVYVGLTAAAALYGAAGLTLAAIAIAAIIPLANVVSVAVLSRYGDATGRRGLGRRLALNPILLACALGILLNWLDLGTPAGIAPALDILAAAALPLGLLTVGAGLDPKAARHAGRAVIVAATAKLIAMPLIAALACRLLAVEGAMAGTAILFAALPVSVSSYVLSRQLGGDATLMANVITIETVLAAATLPVIVVVFA